MIRPDEDTLKLLVAFDKRIYSWFAASMNDHMVMIDELDPDTHMRMRQDHVAKACQLKEIMDTILSAKDTLRNIQQRTAKMEEEPKVNVY